MSQFAFASSRRSRRPSLTPMIDVVFLLLVFFMLASRFGTDNALTLTVPVASADAEWIGPPRLITLREEGIALNGAPTDLSELALALQPLMQSPSDTVLIRATGPAELQTLIDVLETLQAAGLTGAMVVE